jgi:phage terminase small subunit
LKATLDVDARGFEIEETRHSKNGSEYTVFVPNPSLRIQADAERQLLALQKALGLSSDSREKVKKAKQDPKTLPPDPNSAAVMFPHLFNGKPKIVPSKSDEGKETN